jgi:hypothetical protein
VSKSKAALVVLLAASVVALAAIVGRHNEAVAVPSASIPGHTSELKTGGPLEPPPGRTEATVPVDLNEPYSWGLVYLDNSGSDAAQVEALDLGQIPTGLRVLGSYAVPGNAGIGLLSGYAPNSGRPVVGLTIPAKEKYNVVVGLSATAPGRHMISEVRVRYTSGDQEYDATFSDAVVLCAPKVDYPEGCPSSL